MLDCGLRINTLTMLNCKENGTLILAKNNYKPKKHTFGMNQTYYMNQNSIFTSDIPLLLFSDEPLEPLPNGLMEVILKHI